MTEPQQTNPAEIAAQRALDEMYECIRTRQNFRMEAGAGAGKTYSLDKALRLIIDEQGSSLQRNCQQVACITYTNVAIDEIIERTDGHPAVHASTIHSFCWDLIKGFQPHLRAGALHHDSRPKINLMGTDGRELFFTKGSRWKYEAEQRMLLPLSNSSEMIDQEPYSVHLFEFPIEAVSEIIYGSRMGEIDKREIKSALECEDGLSHVSYYTARLDSSSYAIRVEKDN